MITDGSAPPLPANDPREAQRIEHSRLRRRVLYNLHERDIIQRLTETVGNVRREAWPPPDMTANPARHVYTQLAGLYRQIPEVEPPPGGELVAAAVADAGYWQLAQRVQRDALALNNVFVHLSIVEGAPVYRLVWPDLVQVEVDPLRPSKIVGVREWRRDPDDAGKWITLVTRPATREYRALDDRGDDVSRRVLGEEYVESGLYPATTPGGEALMPYIAYRAAETGYAFDPYTGAEAIEGSLQLGVYYTMLAHVFADACWAQRYAVGAEPVGMDVDGGGRRSEIVTDPATLLLLRQSDDSAGQPVVSQWAAPVEPDAMLSAIERYERRVVEMALGTVGVSRRESDVRSAASLAVSREAQREAQRSFEPLFRRSDLELLRLTSALMGGPVDGWRVSYKALAKDYAELAADMSTMQDQIEAGLLDRVSAYMSLHPGLTRPEAAEAVDRIAVVNGDTVPPQTSGAKAQAATDIVARVAAREIPRDAAASLLVELFGFSPDAAERMIGASGAGFTQDTE